jgi:hypothetical protein
MQHVSNNRINESVLCVRTQSFNERIEVKRRYSHGANLTATLLTAAPTLPLSNAIETFRRSKMMYCRVGYIEKVSLGCNI